MRARTMGATRPNHSPQHIEVKHATSLNFYVFSDHGSVSQRPLMPANHSSIDHAISTLQPDA
ncbi:MAG TPA: hypothetical protein VML75_16520, partial [Kofleriaceae bacterium]|nr:hypothetical protein [Kofleriaceae bacterium]